MDDKPFSSSAAVYDLLYAAAGKDYEAEADDLHALIRTRCPRARTLLDVACGTGAHLQHLQRQYDVSGIDASPRMLEEARRRLPAVPLAEADMRTFDVGRTFDVVTCLFSSIGYMRTPAELEDAIAAMSRHVAPGGVLIVDGWVRAQSWRDPGTVQALAGAADGLVASRVVRSKRDGNRTTLELHHLIGTVERIDYVVESHELTLFTDTEYHSAFSRAGLTVEVVNSPHPDRDRYVAVRPHDV